MGIGALLKTRDGDPKETDRAGPIEMWPKTAGNNEEFVSADYGDGCGGLSNDRFKIRIPHRHCDRIAPEVGPTKASAESIAEPQEFGVDLLGALEVEFVGLRDRHRLCPPVRNYRPIVLTSSQSGQMYPRCPAEPSS